MILLDVVTPATTISLGSGDSAMWVVAAAIFAVCCLPFLGRRG